MPAAVVRGILISIGIITALSIAVYENPEVQQWLDEQRRKLATLLRNIGDELDPQSRREAEAFAYGATDDQTISDAAVVATGRSSATTAIRRIAIQDAVDSQEGEERQRLGREYLARRNQQMLEMQERRRIDSPTVSPASASFDSLVDDDGKLKVEENPLLEHAMESEFFNAGTQQDPPLIDPFNDEHTIDRSETPRPVVPPKIKLQHVDPVTESANVASSRQQPVPAISSEELSYDDQLALALAISKEDSTAAAHHSHGDSFADDLRLATAASLRDAHSDHLSNASEEDLYNVTPHLTRASLATLDAQHPSLTPRALPYDPVHEAASFQSAREAATEASSFVFQSDREDTASFASVNEVPSIRAIATSETSAELVNVEDQASDVISEDGIATPDSWTEVGSHDGDGDVEMRPTVATTSLQ